MRILLVEDHADTAELYAHFLRGHGHEVAVAATIAEARAAYDGGCCEVVISDVRLPDGSGWDLMRALRARWPDVRGIVTSAHGYAADVEQSRAAGFERHLTKPVDLEELANAVESLGRAAG